MKALQLFGATPVSTLKLTEIDKPTVKPGWVLVKVYAFGLNHSEVLFRQHEIENDKFEKPRVPGIECVGVIENGSDTDLKVGEKVIAMMGGMGRNFDGSYAEYALLPRAQVFRANTNLDWLHLAAVPETYYTAWGSLFECLQLKPDDALLIRAGSSALGVAAALLAKAMHCRVLATVRSDKNIKLLKEIGVDDVIVDPNGSLADAGLNEEVNKILDLIGPAVLKDSLFALAPQGIVCSTGILGGETKLKNFDPIRDIPNGRYLTGFYSNHPTQDTIDKILNFIDNNELLPIIAKTYDFADVQDFSRDLEEGTIGGKGVVIVAPEATQQA